jgi:DNA-binding XRE family transcriptional regulator
VGRALGGCPLRRLTINENHSPKRANDYPDDSLAWKENVPRSIRLQETMGNEELKNHRKEVGMPQFLLAQRSGVTRMRLSLFETGQVSLSADEIAAVRRALKEYIAQRAAQFTKALNRDDAVAV